MKINYTTSNGRISVEVEGEDHKSLFENLATFQEVFDESKCGKCNSENLRFVTRKVDGNIYYELRCVDCGAKLAFGVHRDGNTLFPKRRDADGNWRGNNGWVKWNKDKGVEE